MRFAQGDAVVTDEPLVATARDHRRASGGALS